MSSIGPRVQAARSSWAVAIGIQRSWEASSSASPLRENARPHRLTGPRQHCRLPQLKIRVLHEQKAAVHSRRRFVGDVATGLTFTIVRTRARGRGRLAPERQLNSRARRRRNGRERRARRGQTETSMRCARGRPPGRTVVQRIPAGEAVQGFRVLDKKGKTSMRPPSRAGSHAHRRRHDGESRQAHGIQKPLARSASAVHSAPFERRYAVIGACAGRARSSRPRTAVCTRRAAARSPAARSAVGPPLDSGPCRSRGLDPLRASGACLPRLALLPIWPSRHCHFDPACASSAASLPQRPRQRFLMRVCLPSFIASHAGDGVRVIRRRDGDRIDVLAFLSASPGNP